MSDEGPINAAHDALRLTLADTPAFRDWCGVGSVDAAYAKVYPNGLPTTSGAVDSHTEAALETYRPYVEFIADEENPLIISRESGGSDVSLKVSGTIRSRFVRSVTSGEDGDDVAAARNMQREVCNIVYDSGQLWGGTNDHLRVWRVEVNGPMFGSVDAQVAQGDFIAFDVTWHWGNQTSD